MDDIYLHIAKHLYAEGVECECHIVGKDSELQTYYVKCNSEHHTTLLHGVSPCNKFYWRKYDDQILFVSINY